MTLEEFYLNYKNSYNHKPLFGDYVYPSLYSYYEAICVFLLSWSTVVREECYEELKQYFYSAKEEKQIEYLCYNLIQYRILIDMINILSK